MIAELRSYLPTLLELVEKWRAEKGDGAGSNNVERASKQVTDCIRAFISSGGKWSGAWPKMASTRHANFLVTDLYLFMALELFAFTELEFLRPLCDGFDRVRTSESELEPRFERSFETFESLMDFLADLSEEEYRQAGHLSELASVMI